MDQQQKFNVVIADTTTLAQLATDIAAYSVVVNPLTGVASARANLGLIFPSTGWKTSASTGKRMSEGGLFSFGVTGQRRRYSITIPGFDETCILNGGPQPTETDTAAWISWVQANGTHIAVESNGEDSLTGFLDCKLNSRNSRKNLTKKTTRTT